MLAVFLFFTLILSILFTIELANLKNVILEFSKNMIIPPLIWVFDFIGWFSKYVAFEMKSNDCVSLLNMLHKDL